jgi:phage baseplate assembly protein V
MIRYGNISEVDAAKGRARVHFVEDDIVSDWLPVSVPTSLGNQYEFWPEVNMFVWCAMDENSESGVVGGALYDDGNTPPVGDPDKTVVTFKDGTTVTYDRSANELVIDCVGDVTIKCVNATVEASTKVTIDSPSCEFTGNVSVSGNVDANGDVKAAASSVPISLLTHKHSGVVPGGGISGTPVP